MREVRVYGGDFPKIEDVLCGNPTVTFPKEIWLAQVQPGEFAVRYKDFKTGRPRNPRGESAQSSEICRIFGSVDEARADSRKVSDENWVVLCLIYDHTGSLVETVLNTRRVSKFTAVAYAGIFFWIGIYTAMGMGLLWLLSVVVLAAVNKFVTGHQVFVHFGLLEWTLYALAGLLLGIFILYSRIRLRGVRAVSRVQNKLNSMPPLERKRFEEVNTLYGSHDPEERKKFLKLAAEYREIINQALKK